ncbi:MAG TPA: beta-ketoacyl-[acyl-carrier-protein] synthase family protein [Chthoniobacterales bacterium]
MITGIGVITACGLTVPDFWDSIVHGRSGAKPITRFDTSGLPTTIAAEITNFNCANYLPRKVYKRFDLGIQYAAAASLEAVADSGLKISTLNADRVGLIHANSMEGMESAFQVYPAFAAGGYKKLGPGFLLNNYFGAASGELAHIHGIKGHAITYSAGSASGSDVLTLAASMIADDDVDAIVVGASEAPLLVQVLGGFCNAHILSRNNDNPGAAMKPFDRDHDGFVLGEGAAFFVLEEKTHALARNARIYVEFAGGGRACEAHHAVNIHPDGVGMKASISKALRKAKMSATEVQYINAHGTATDLNDKIEADAFRSYFGAHCKKVAVSATKAVTGHLLAASGAVETAVCALSIYHQMIPAVHNLKNPVEGDGVDFVMDSPRPYPVEAALNLTAGFGGKNSCIILRKSH